jgi:protein-disulfide isomerase
MNARKIFPLVITVMTACAPAAFSQSAEDVKSLRRDLDAVRDSQKIIQGQLDTVLKLLQQGAGAAAPAPGGMPAAFKEAMLSIDGAPVLGDKNAKVAIVEFSDYQCPFCGRNFQQTFPEINTDYIKTGKVKYIFRDFPLDFHPFALKASEAARCAGEQGKYWEMHDTLFKNQSALQADNLVQYAKDSGADGAQFKTCLDSGKETAKVKADQAAGQKAGVSGTPGFFVGTTQTDPKTIKATKFINGAMPYASFKDAIDTLLAEAK